MTQPNYRYRALSNDEAERRAVADSFARSVLWGFKVEASEGERVLVDATAFFLRDAHGVVERLRGSRQGNYRFDETRSALLFAAHQRLPRRTPRSRRSSPSLVKEPGPLCAWRCADRAGGDRAPASFVGRIARC
jgi:hypothetical protein